MADAPSVVAPPPILDIPNSDPPHREGEAAAQSPPSSRTSVEDLTVMGAIEGLGVEQAVEDDDPSIPEPQRKSRRAHRYQRAAAAARAEANKERRGRLEAERTLRKLYGEDEPAVPESNLSASDPHARADTHNAADINAEDEAPAAGDEAPEQHDDAGEHEAAGGEREAPPDETIEELQHRLEQAADQQRKQDQLDVVFEHRAALADVECRKRGMPGLNELRQMWNASGQLPVQNGLAEIAFNDIKANPAGSWIEMAILHPDNAALRDRLNRATPEQQRLIIAECAGEWKTVMGHRQASIRAQQQRRHTKAPPPMKMLKGGGAGPPSGLAAVNAYMKKQGYRD